MALAREIYKSASIVGVRCHRARLFGLSDPVGYTVPFDVRYMKFAGSLQTWVRLHAAATGA